MLNISKIDSRTPIFFNNLNDKKSTNINDNKYSSIPCDLKNVSSANLKAYHPSFTAKKTDAIQKSEKYLPSAQKQFEVVAAKLDKTSLSTFVKLQKTGILSDNSSNDGSTVLENLYKIATEPRILGLDDKGELVSLRNKAIYKCNPSELDRRSISDSWKSISEFLSRSSPSDLTGKPQS